MMDQFKATLRDTKCVSDIERRQAEQRFCEALASELGGANRIASAYLTYLAAEIAQDPALQNSTETEREAVVRWIKAECAASSCALPALGRHRRGHF